MDCFVLYEEEDEEEEDEEEDYGMQSTPVGSVKVAVQIWFSNTTKAAINLSVCVLFQTIIPVFNESESQVIKDIKEDIFANIEELYQWHCR